ncbi:MAG: hypothetical protein JXR63_00720 [Spirochaetales bacterium]|nr:hypothetical protein [Spirochaetales bacterium]
MKKKLFFIAFVALFAASCFNPITKQSSVNGEWVLTTDFDGGSTVETWNISEEKIVYSTVTSGAFPFSGGYEGQIVYGSSLNFNSGDEYIAGSMSGTTEYLDKGYALLEVESGDKVVYRVFRWASLDGETYSFTQAGYCTTPEDFSTWTEEFATRAEALKTTADADKAEDKGLIYAFAYASSGVKRK